MYVRQHEGYRAAAARWRVRNDAYNDAYAMAWCCAKSKDRSHASMVARAFYGVELMYLTDVSL